MINIERIDQDKTKIIGRGPKWEVYIKLSEEPSEVWTELYYEASESEKQGTSRLSCISGEYLVLQCVPEYLESLLVRIRKNVETTNRWFKQTSARLNETHTKAVKKEEIERAKIEDVAKKFGL